MVFVGYHILTPPSNPATMVLSSVLLPAPLGPTMPNFSLVLAIKGGVPDRKMEDLMGNKKRDSNGI